MKITVPDAKPFKIGMLPPGDVTPTFGQTGNAQYSQTFGPIAEGLSFYTGGGTYDPEGVDRVESYIEGSALTDRESRYLRAYGIGSSENFNAALSYLSKQKQNEDVISRSSGLNLFFSDPGLHASIFSTL